MQHLEETSRKCLYFWPPHINVVTTLPCEVIVLLLTTNNSYCVVHALAQKITETTKSLKICYFVFILKS